MADSKGFNPIRFAGEVRQEGRKVTWTAPRETLITSIMVFIMVVLAALFLALVDAVMRLVIVRFFLERLPQLSEVVRYGVFGGLILVVGVVAVVLFVRSRS